jgi:hypothetical protein
VKRAALLAVVALAAGCGGSAAQPKDDPGTFALRILGLIVHNHYSQVWDDMHPVDQKVAPFAEYVGCESRSPVIAVPRTVKVVSVTDESVGLGDGTFVQSKAVEVRLGFRGGLHLVHTVHVVADSGNWTWILPSWRFRDYRADRCPTDPGSAAPPQQS